MKQGSKTQTDFASFSPAKELKRSESEEAGFSKDHESSESEQVENWPEQQSLTENSLEEEQPPVSLVSEKGQEPDLDAEFETPSLHHFRGSSFGNDSESDDTPESNFERLVTSYEQTLARQQTLDQQMKDMHDAHAAQKDVWENRYKRASLELERLTQRNEELVELVTAKEEEILRLKEDLDTLRLETKEFRQAEARTKDVMRKLEEELVRD